MPEATTTVRGTVRFATKQEVSAGTATNSVVTPALLRSVVPKITLESYMADEQSYHANFMIQRPLISRTGTPKKLTGTPLLKDKTRYLVVQNREHFWQQRYYRRVPCKVKYQGRMIDTNVDVGMAIPSGRLSPLVYVYRDDDAVLFEVADVLSPGLFHRQLQISTRIWDFSQIRPRDTGSLQSTARLAGGWYELT